MGDYGLRNQRHSRGFDSVEVHLSIEASIDVAFLRFKRMSEEEDINIITLRHSSPLTA